MIRRETRELTDAPISTGSIDLTVHLAHNLNNAFAIIIGGLSLVRDQLIEAKSFPESLGLVDDALSAGREGAQLLEKVLACIGHQVLRPRSVAVNELIDRLRPELAELLPEACALQVDLATELPTTMVDPERLERALRNILDNARRAMPRGGRLLVRTSQSEHPRPARPADSDLDAGRFISITVRDSGIGMTNEILNQAWIPFFTTRPPATGLGLSEAYGFARQCGGCLTMISAPREGTSVTIYLPAIPD